MHQQKDLHNNKTITAPPLNKLHIAWAETLPFSSFLTVKNSRSKLQNHKMNF